MKEREDGGENEASMEPRAVGDVGPARVAVSALFSCRVRHVCRAVRTWSLDGSGPSDDRRWKLLWAIDRNLDNRPMAFDGLPEHTRSVQMIKWQTRLTTRK